MVVQFDLRQHTKTNQNNPNSSLEHRRKELVNKMNAMREEIKKIQRGAGVSNSGNRSVGNASPSGLSLQERMKNMKSLLDKQKLQLQQKRTNTVPSRRIAYNNMDSDVVKEITQVSRINTGSNIVNDDTIKKMSTEIIDKIAEIEDIEKSCAKENATKNISRSYRFRSPSVVNTKSMMDSLLTRPATFASYGNGNRVTIPSILDDSLQRRLKTLGKRTKRLNSISHMRERLNSVSYERNRLNSIQLSSAELGNNNTERSKVISDGRKRLSDITGDQSFSRRTGRLNSYSTTEERDKAIASGRDRLNSLSYLDINTLGTGGTKATLGTRTQRLGSIANIRAQLMQLNENNNNKNGNRYKSKNTKSNYTGIRGSSRKARPIPTSSIETTKTYTSPKTKKQNQRNRFRNNKKSSRKFK